MKRCSRIAVWLSGLLLVATGCSAKTAKREAPEPLRGGTLRIGMPTGLPGSPLQTGPALDPQRDYSWDSNEIFRCCLLRTLFSHEGKPTNQGGAILRPDLAAALPTVSADGLAWTIHLKSGIRYGPPLQDVEVTSGDIVRALAREADPKVGAGYPFYYSVIQGFDDYAAGKAQSISGLETPDARTLIVHVNAPSGDLPYRFTLAATAPIPPMPSGGAGGFGVATGHDGGYGTYLVASGPYMLEGSEKLDFSKPPQSQTPASGYVPGKSLTLVRNPSWSAQTDALRPAYVDRIEMAIRGTRDELNLKVESGAIDLSFYPGPPPQVDAALVHRLLADPTTKNRVFIGLRDFVRYVELNLAVPPFDDVHVRKAFAYAVYKPDLLKLRGEFYAQAAGHMALNSLENDLLVDYDPYRTPDPQTALAKAREEMKRSAYDTDHDGMCDTPVCHGIRALTPPPFNTLAQGIARDVAGIGLLLDVKATPAVFDVSGKPVEKVPLILALGWGKDHLNASNVLQGLFYGPSIVEKDNNVRSLIGATPDQLRRWGYRVTSVPSIDAKIRSCVALVGDAQTRCWAEADQQLMEEVTAAVPFAFEDYVQIMSPRIAVYSFDQFGTLSALDRIALKPEATPS